jgi:hypothetical protein
MDSEVLERALQASKAAQDGTQNGAPATEKLHFPPPVPSLDGPIWFAMLRGKQTGPLTRAELMARANDGEIGPRTYLWREGMNAWQRALEVADLSEMFPQLPPPARPLPAPLPSAAPVQAGQATVAAAAGDRTTIEPVPAGGRPPQADVSREPALAPAPQNALDLARWATSEFAQQQAPRLALPAPPVPQKLAPQPVSRSTPMFESTAPTERGPFMVFLGLIALAAAAIVLWIVLAAAPEKKDEAHAEARSQPNPAAAPHAAHPAEPRPGEPSSPEQAVPTGLTADQVHRKLDENKPALQGCVDDALRRDPHLKVGKIHVATTIAPDGQVTAAKIDQRSVDESALGACLKGATRKIVFPQFVGAAFEVDIPIVVPAGK